MLLDNISDDEKKKLIELASLLIVLDKQLMWDGKSKGEINSDTNMHAVSFLPNEVELKILADWKKELKPGWLDNMPSNAFSDRMKNQPSRAERDLLSALSNFPLQSNTEATKVRWPVAEPILKEILKNSAITNPTSARVVAFNLLMIALASSQITDIKNKFFEVFKTSYAIDSESFDEIQNQAKKLHQEIQKTIALILE